MKFTGNWSHLDLTFCLLEFVDLSACLLEFDGCLP